MTDLLSEERVALTPVESVNWLTDATIAELLVALVKESCTVPVLPAMEMVVELARPVLAPRKLSWPVCAEAMTATETARVVLPTLAELMENGGEGRGGGQAGGGVVERAVEQLDALEGRRSC